MTAARVIRTLIVDDEPPARERVRRMLAGLPGFRVIGECGDGRVAVREIVKRKPDLVFLDIQMPGLSGFDVIHAIGPANLPVVVFVTAHDRYALQAFEVHAVDYLLKPFSRERFTAALEAAVREVQRRSAAGARTNLAELLAALDADGRLDPRILVRTGGRLTLVPVDRIDWIEAAGNYVELHVGQERHLLRATMNAMVDRLGRGTFARIHRSRIVNVTRIQELRQLRTGDWELRLKDGRTLPMSRRFRSGLDRFLDAR